MPEQICSDFVYSEEYWNFLIKYDNDLESINNIVEPDCVNIINSQFLVAYKKLDSSQNLYDYGYNSVPKCFGLMDTTVLESIGANTVRSLPGLGLTGENVLIGFVDTGIDYRNPLFINRDGTSRIEAIWDQSISGSNAPIFGFGEEFRRQEISRALNEENPYDSVATRDENGHGTFLASVAAGGENREEDFSGIAPSARLAVVKLKQVKNNLREYMLINPNVECYGEDDIMLGVKYLINKAVELDMPLVICVGLGSNQGDHNGNSNLELYFQTISNLRGVCVITAGGNEVGARGHFSGNNRINKLAAKEDMEISVGAEDKGFVMEVWGNAPGILALSVLSPTGERKMVPSPVRDGRSQFSFLYEGTPVTIDNYVVDPNTGDQLVVLRFLNPTEGIWTVVVEETVGIIGGGFDAWLPIAQFLNSETVFVRPDPDVTICTPASGSGSITVGGYNHSNNALYLNSSRGFTRKGNIKPDIVAPAVDVQGVLAAGDNLLFIRKTGSSVASAVTAGAVGLILEWGLVKGNNRGITTQVIRQMLIRGSRQVADVEYPSRSWGWGALDVYNAFNSIRDM